MKNSLVLGNTDTLKKFKKIQHCTGNVSVRRTPNTQSLLLHVRYHISFDQYVKPLFIQKPSEGFILRMVPENALPELAVSEAVLERQLASTAPAFRTSVTPEKDSC